MGDIERNPSFILRFYSILLSLRKGEIIMKKLFTFLLIGVSAFALAGCDTVSTSLDEDDVNIEMPEDYEYTKVISYDEYSRTLTFQNLTQALRGVKMDLYTIGGGVTTDTIAIATHDFKTGERIGAAKSKISSTFNPMIRANGNQMMYVRGNRAYVGINASYTVSAASTTKTYSIIDKYHMDLPEDDTNGMGAFFSIDPTDPNTEGFVNPYTFVDAMKEGGMIQDPDTVIRTAREGGRTFFKIEFANPTYLNQGLIEYEFIVVMNGRKFDGLYMHVKGDAGNNNTYYIGATIIPFSKRYDDVPTEFTGYEKTMEQFIQDVQNSMMNAK